MIVTDSTTCTVTIVNSNFYFIVADWKKKNFIDRFVQSVVSHGPSLIPLTRDEHGDGEESVLNFLNPRREGNMGMNYFRNKLQVNIALLQVCSRAVLQQCSGCPPYSTYAIEPLEVTDFVINFTLYTLDLTGLEHCVPSNFS